MSALTAAGCPVGTCQALTAAQPAAISNYSRVRSTPLALGVLLALLAGLPLGVAGGRWAWALFAGSVGVSPSTTAPLDAVALTVPIALLLANTIAVGPGWAAARIKPAVALRNE